MSSTYIRTASTIRDAVKSVDHLAHDVQDHHCKFHTKTTFFLGFLTFFLIVAAGVVDYVNENYERAYLIICFATPCIFLTFCCSLIQLQVPKRHRIGYVTVASIISAVYSFVFWYQGVRYWRAADSPTPNESLDYLSPRDFNTQSFWFSIYFDGVVDEQIESNQMTAFGNFSLYTIPHTKSRESEYFLDSVTIIPHPLRRTMSDPLDPTKGSYAQDCQVFIDYETLAESLHCMNSIDFTDAYAYMVPGTVDESLRCDVMSFNFRPDVQMLIEKRIFWSQARLQIQYSFNDATKNLAHMLPVIHDIPPGKIYQTVAIPAYFYDKSLDNYFVTYDDWFSTNIVVPGIAEGLPMYFIAAMYQIAIEAELLTIGTEFKVESHIFQNTITYTFNDFIVGILAISSTSIAVFAVLFPNTLPFRRYFLDKNVDFDLVKEVKEEQRHLTEVDDELEMMKLTMAQIKEAHRESMALSGGEPEGFGGDSIFLSETSFEESLIIDDHNIDTGGELKKRPKQHVTRRRASCWRSSYPRAVGARGAFPKRCILRCNNLR